MAAVSVLTQRRETIVGSWKWWFSNRIDLLTILRVPPHLTVSVSTFFSVIQVLASQTTKIAVFSTKGCGFWDIFRKEGRKVFRKDTGTHLGNMKFHARSTTSNTPGASEGFIQHMSSREMGSEIPTLRYWELGTPDAGENSNYSILFTRRTKQEST